MVTDRREAKEDVDAATWLFGSPQFWLGFVACAVLVLLVVAPAVFRLRRTVRVYGAYGSVPFEVPGGSRRVARFDRAPVPMRDPFHRPSPAIRPTGAMVAAPGCPEASGSSGQGGNLDRRVIREARKRAVWHPHPDDEVPPWRPW